MKMKLTKKIIALLLTLMLTFAAFGALTVFATEEDDLDTYTQEDVVALANSLGISEEEAAAYIFGNETDDASATDTSKTDISMTDVYKDITFEPKTIEHYGISFLAPATAQVYSLESSDYEVYSGAGYTKLDLLSNYNLIGLCQFEDDAKGSVVYYEISCQEDSPYAAVLGEYNDLTQEQIDDIVKTKEAQGKDNSYEYDSVYVVRNGGQNYLVARIDQDNAGEGYCITQAEISTVINGDYYNILCYFQHSGSVSDLDKVDEAIKSVQVGGQCKPVNTVKVLSIIALVLAALLLIAIAFIIFFIVRFSAYSKASGSKFNIIGFDMPKAVEDKSGDKKFKAHEGIKDSTKK